jgi:hypothetical protein
LNRTVGPKISRGFFAADYLEAVFASVVILNNTGFHARQRYLHLKDRRQTISAPDAPLVLPQTFEGFEELKAKLRGEEPVFWATQPKGIRREELGSLFNRKEGELPEPWVSMEPL